MACHGNAGSAAFDLAGGAGTASHERAVALIASDRTGTADLIADKQAAQTFFRQACAQLYAELLLTSSSSATSPTRRPSGPSS